MTERRTLFRALVGLNAALYVVYVVRVFLVVQSGENPWAGMTLAWFLGLAFVVFGVMVPLAAIGLAAPLALFDLAAAWYSVGERSPFGTVSAACFVLAFAVGVTLQVRRMMSP